MLARAMLVLLDIFLHVSPPPLAPQMQFCQRDFINAGIYLTPGSAHFMHLLPVATIRPGVCVQTYLKN